MNYKEFKAKILGEIKEFYGCDAEVSIRSNEGATTGEQELLEIRLVGSENRVNPSIYIEKIYGLYTNDGLQFGDCMDMIIEIRESCERKAELRCHVKENLNWEAVKDKIYPVLLDEKIESRKNDVLITSSFLDLTVAYTLRLSLGAGWIGCCMISDSIFQHYAISKEQLHDQALQNLRQDEYRFYDVVDFLTNGEDGATKLRILKPGALYLFGNSLRVYGSAGMLNEELLHEVLGKKSYYILPVSTHEVLLVPDCGGTDQQKLDEILYEIGGYITNKEGLLISHSYYYCGKTGEIKIHKEEKAGQASAKME